jgi:hypothetical protein
MQGERRIPVFEPVVDRVREFQLLAVGAGVGEISVLLQGIDVGLLWNVTQTCGWASAKSADVKTRSIAKKHVCLTMTRRSNPSQCERRHVQNPPEETRLRRENLHKERLT